MDKIACPYRDRCMRGGPEYPMVLFPLENRKVKIRAVVISQEPAAQRRRLTTLMGDAIERQLRCEGLSIVPPHPLLRAIQSTIGRPYDAFDDEIYWTHALKCIPEDDKDIRREWKRCSSECIKLLRSELRAIPTKELVIITIGGYSTGLMLSLLNNKDRWLSKPPGINDFVESLGSEAAIRNGLDIPNFKKPYRWEDKTFYLTSFIHPSNRNRTITEASERVEAEEISFIRARLAADDGY